MLLMSDKPKKVIFLDHDGVICLADNWGSRNKKKHKYAKKNNLTVNQLNSKEIPVEVTFDDFDKKAVKVLNEIITETDCEIVVSSDWRFYANLDQLGTYYESQGIIKKPISVTEVFKDLYPREWSKYRFLAEIELERSMEINHWLENNPEVTQWVAIDDLNMSMEYLSHHFLNPDNPDKKPGLTNFVHTPKSSEGIKQSGIKEKVLSFLS